MYRGVLDGTPVAVKVMDQSSGADQGEREFLQEVSVLCRLHHPHIVLLLGCCQERFALVYELCEFGSLDEHLFRQGYPDLHWTDRVRIATEMATALAYLHSAPEPIVHMDLKPSNVLLTRSVSVKLGDVGLSRVALALAGGDVSAVQDSRLVGTLAYMDPEYLRSGMFGPKSDIYSLGIVLLQLLTAGDGARVISGVEAALQRADTGGPGGGDLSGLAAMLDRRAGGWPPVEALPLARLALRCASLTRSARPDLRAEVLPVLQEAAKRAQLWEQAGAGGGRMSGPGHADDSSPPAMFICPITQDVMNDPVVAADGYTYERFAIEAWSKDHATSPMTNLPLQHSAFTPNITIRSAIQEWQEQQHRGGAGR